MVAINKGVSISSDLQDSIICLFRRFIYQPSETENSSYVVESYSLRLLISLLAKGIAVDRSAVVSLLMRSRVVCRARLSLPSVGPVVNTCRVGSALVGGVSGSENPISDWSENIFSDPGIFERYSGIGCAEPGEIKSVSVL